jgi:hypothetical protein
MRFPLLGLPRVSPNLQTHLLSAALLASVCVTGCGGGAETMGGGGGAGGTTTVTVVTTSTANDQLSQFGMVLNSLKLTSQSGDTADLISAPINAEFLHVNGISEPLLSVTVPQGTYTTATASVGSSGFSCVTLDPSDGHMHRATFAYGYTPQANVTVSLPSPITIAGGSALALLNLQVSQSASYNNANCAATSNYLITPAFTLTLASNANSMQAGLKGFVGAKAASSFTVTAADGRGCGSSGCGSPVSGPVWQVAADAATVYQGLGGFSDLEAGVSVDINAALQPDGSLLAKRIAMYDANPSNLSATIGPVMVVYGAGPALYNFPTEDFGVLLSDVYTFNFSDATFQTSGQLSNVQSLPFPASFGPANVVAGQNIYASANSLDLEPPPVYMPATTITLIPQIINGTVNAIGSEGGFTTYTVALAPYDLFPTFAVQAGQTTVLTNPNTVVVYADSNTQMLNTSPVAVGGVGRFYGLVFNDNGTLRMDCSEVLDGVAE